MPAMIRATGISKRYGNFQAVHPVDLEVRAGEVFGFLGLNGAGKTTTLRMLGGVLPPSSGSVVIDGVDLESEPVEARRRMSFLPDRPYLYDKLTAREFLRFRGEVFGMEESTLAREVDFRLEEQLLLPQADALIESFSHGMKQRLTLAGALLTRPRVLIVDEPMVGLDPRGARQIKQVFRDIAADGRTVFLSTHTLDVAAEVCDRLAIVHQGRIAVMGTLAEVVPPGEHLEDVFLRITGVSGERSEAADASGEP
jgi:ABC-2 type transport system ATP-binding protein